TGGTTPSDDVSSAVACCSSQNRHPSNRRHITMSFQRNHALLVVHSDDAVVTATIGLEKHAVRKERADDSVAHFGELPDDRRNTLDLLHAEQSAITSMRIQARHGNQRIVDLPQIFQSRYGMVQHALHPTFRNQVDGFSKRN